MIEFDAFDAGFGDVDQGLAMTARSTLPANLDVDLFVQADRASGSGVSVLL